MGAAVVQAGGTGRISHFGIQVPSTATVGIDLPTDYGGATLAPSQPKWVGSHHNWTRSSDRVDAHRTGTEGYQVLPMTVPCRALNPWRRPLVRLRVVGQGESVRALRRY